MLTGTASRALPLKPSLLLLINQGTCVGVGSISVPL